MTIESTLYRLRHDPMVVHRRVLPSRSANYAGIPALLDDRVVAALRSHGITRLYTHQAKAIGAALRGENPVLVTPTASGKTLAYNVPVLHALVREPTARALYLFPTKALTQDQHHELERLTDHLDVSIQVAVYDGDTPGGARRTIRASANVVMTNPDMLHTGILPHHTKWLSFWTNLRYIVLDEVHQYRGIFGSHLANLLRRMRRIAQFYGCTPQFVCSSATIANAKEFVERLIGAPVTVIDESGAPQGEKEFFFVNPPVVDAELNLRRSSVLEARRIAGAFLADDVQTIAFARSRLTTEVLLTYLRGDSDQLEVSADVIRGYRGGYLPAERREIERGLREGTVRGVVSTNALELGIDIGRLEACVMVGYPGTIASTWQQAGRVGRRGGRSAAVLIASAAPLDQFLVTHPEWFFAASPEHARINPDNLHILLKHIKCAAFELPFKPGEGFGTLPAEIVAEILSFLVGEGVLHEAADTYYWTAPQYPAEGVSLRTAGDDNILVTEQPGGTVIGEVDRFSVHQMCFPGAIYLHEGTQYHVDVLEWETSRALVRPVEVDYYTRAITKTAVRPFSTFREAENRGVGEVEVTTRATGYKKIKLFTHEVIGRGELDLPDSQMQTTAYWLTLPVEVADRDRRDYGPNWAQQRLRARARDGFRCRRCGISEAELGRELDVHHKVPFREFDGRYTAANALDNLVSLCPSCHSRAEPWYKSDVAAGVQGLANALGNIVPLFLMCDPRDIGITSELRNVHTGYPTIFVYEYVPGGVGFAEQLFEVHEQILAAVERLIADCPCEAGCPSCVGPALLVGDRGKEWARRLLREVL